MPPPPRPRRERSAGGMWRSFAKVKSFDGLALSARSSNSSVFCESAGRLLIIIGLGKVNVMDH